MWGRIAWGYGKNRPCLRRDCVQPQMGGGEQVEGWSRTGQRWREDAEAKEEWLEQELGKESITHGEDNLNWKRVMGWCQIGIGSVWRVKDGCEEKLGERDSINGVRRLRWRANEELQVPTNGEETGKTVKRHKIRVTLSFLVKYIGPVCLGPGGGLERGLEGGICDWLMGSEMKSQNWEEEWLKYYYLSGERREESGLEKNRYRSRRPSVYLPKAWHGPQEILLQWTLRNLLARSHCLLGRLQVDTTNNYSVSSTNKSLHHWSEIFMSRCYCCITWWFFSPFELFHLHLYKHRNSPLDCAVEHF